MSKRLQRGVDWHGWCWQYENDPDFGNMLDTSEVYERRGRWANGYERKGRWVKVQIVLAAPSHDPQGRTD